MIPLRSATMAYRDIKQKKSERGSITLEAAVFLTLFILFYVAMMDLIQIAKAQVILQYSVNEAAKEISTYNYILTKVGITEKRAETAGDASEFVGKFTDVADALENVNAALTGGDIEGIFNAASNMGDKLSRINVEDVPGDLISLLKTWITDGISDFAIQKIVEAEVKKQIGMMSGKEPDRFLREMGIEGGMSGLDFEKSAWADESVGDGIPVLEVAVTYTIHFNLGYFELESKEYTLCAKTALW